MFGQSDACDKRSDRAFLITMLNPNLEAIELNKDEYQRYSRHIILPEVGLEGQKRLKAASVLCIGSGGLGLSLIHI